MQRIFLFILMLSGLLFSCQRGHKSRMLWNHLSSDFHFPESRGVKAAFIDNSKGRTLLITTKDESNWVWCTLPAPGNGWYLSTRKSIEATFSNIGNSIAKILFWVKANKGWDAVVTSATLNPGQRKTLYCNLRDTFPDGTPKISPARVCQIQVMLVRPRPGTKITVHSLKATGKTGEWHMPKGRLEVPDLTEEQPEAGKRVKYQPACMRETKKYIGLYLPTDWKPQHQYPVIVEFPGNIYYTPTCYSSGRPEACTIGYGISKGKGAIWISMPFVDKQSDNIIEDGFGNPDYTAQITLETVKEIVEKYGGDKNNLFIAGFSRGAIACGYIGLRNQKIASLWKGIIACQHYDGDGWHGANLEGAKKRIKFFKGSYFLVDNNDVQLRNMLEESGVKATFVNSGLRAHATAMFLDNRPSTLAVRKWFHKLIII